MDLLQVSFSYTNQAPFDDEEHLHVPISDTLVGTGSLKKKVN